MESVVASGRCHGGYRQIVVGSRLQTGHGVRICVWRQGFDGEFVSPSGDSPSHGLVDDRDVQNDISGGRDPRDVDLTIAAGRCGDMVGRLTSPDGVGVAVGVGDGVGLNVAVGSGVEVTVGVAAGVSVGIGVGVGEGVGVSVGVAVGIEGGRWSCCWSW